MKLLRIAVAVTTLGVVGFTLWLVAVALIEGGMAMFGLVILGPPALLLSIIGLLVTWSTWRGGRALWGLLWTGLMSVVLLAMGGIGDAFAVLSMGEGIRLGTADGAVVLSYGGAFEGGSFYYYPTELAALVAGFALLAATLFWTAAAIRRPAMAPAPAA